MHFFITTNTNSLKKMSMEALAINYLTHTLWTWLAFLTTSLSFWKTNSYSSPHHHLSPRLPSPSPPQPPQTATEPDPDDEIPSTISSLVSSSPVSNYTKIATTCLLEHTRSGKFRVYYGEDEDDIIRNVERRTMGSVRVEEQKRVDVDVDGWEAVLKLKTAEMGWYRYQDLTVLNGNVVKLWNHRVL
ncbi:hypothetical protein SSX86_009755 [Deinandra increscens subsp. villosa]|uniref:Uncharacterized protein n=1 Tax=Deinandra increscens subsp. villosa TaxID=3103831 RepID=A0AAP0H4B9_9ASTR